MMKTGFGGPSFTYSTLAMQPPPPVTAAAPPPSSSSSSLRGLLKTLQEESRAATATALAGHERLFGVFTNTAASTSSISVASSSFVGLAE